MTPLTSCSIPCLTVALLRGEAVSRFSLPRHRDGCGQTGSDFTFSFMQMFHPFFLACILDEPELGELPSRSRRNQAPWEARAGRRPRWQRHRHRDPPSLGRSRVTTQGSSPDLGACASSAWTSEERKCRGREVNQGSFFALWREQPCRAPGGRAWWLPPANTSRAAASLGTQKREIHRVPECVFVVGLSPQSYLRWHE